MLWLFFILLLLLNLYYQRLNLDDIYKLLMYIFLEHLLLLTFSLFIYINVISFTKLEFENCIINSRIYKLILLFQFFQFFQFFKVLLFKLN